MKQNINYWKQIEANSYTGCNFQRLYKIPFVTTHDSACFENNFSALENCDFFTEAISELLETGRIKEVTSKPYIVNPLSVSGPTEKKRLILDLRHVNKHVYKIK